MKIITKKPVIINGKVVNQEGFSYANEEDKTVGVLAPPPSGATLPYYTSPAAPPIQAAIAPTPKVRGQKLKAGIEKAKGIYQKGQESGLFSSLGSFLGIGKQNEPAPPVAPITNIEEPKNNTMKYVLIGGGVLAIGALIYFATKSSGKSGK